MRSDLSIGRNLSFTGLASFVAPWNLLSDSGLGLPGLTGSQETGTESPRESHLSLHSVQDLLAKPSTIYPFAYCCLALRCRHEFPSLRNEAMTVGYVLAKAPARSFLLGRVGLLNKSGDDEPLGRVAEKAERGSR